MARKVIKIEAFELEAGDLLVVKTGSVRHFYRVCEVKVWDDHVHYVYKTQGRFEHRECHVDDKLRVIE